MGIELIIPFIASVVITILLRRLDRSNYRLTQIKRYTARLTEEINQVAVSRIQAVKDSGIELEIMNKQARKIAEEIHTVSAETRVLLDSIKSNKQYLDSISTELAGVVELTSEIQKESSYVQNGLSIIQTQRNELTRLEKDVQKLQGEASGIVGAFQDKLGQRTEDILGSLASKIVEMESLIEIKSDKLDEFVKTVSGSFQDRIRNEMEVLVQESVGRVELLESRANDILDGVRESEKNLDFKLSRFKDASDIIADKVERIDSRLNEKAENANLRVEEKFLVYEKKIQDRFDLIFDQVSQSKEAFLKGLKQEVDSIRSEVEGMSLETMTKRDEILYETRRQAESINSNITLFQEKYLEAENKLLKQADVKKSELLRQIDLFEDEFKRTSDRLKLEATETRESVMEGLHNFESDLDSVRNAAEESTRKMILELREELEDNLQSVHADKTGEYKTSLFEIEDKIKELTQNTASKIKSVDEYFLDLKSALNESAREIVSELDEKARGISDLVEKEIVKVENKFENLADAWDNELEKIKDGSIQSINNLEDRLKNIHIEGRDLLEKFRGEYDIQKAQLKEFISGQEKLLDGLTDKISGDIESRIGIALQNSEGVIENLNQSAESFFDLQEEKISKLNATIDTKISRQLASLMDKGEFQLGKLEEKVSKYIQDVRKNVEESLRFAKEDSEKQIGNFNKEIQRNFREIERTNRTFIDSAKNEFERTRVELEEIRSTIHSDLDLLQDSKERIISGFSEESGAIAQEINSLSLQIQDIKAYSEHFANVEEIIRNSEDTIRSISEKMEELHSSKDSLDEYTKNAEMLKIAKKEMESEIRLLDVQRIKIEDMERSLASASNLCNIISEKADNLEENYQKINLFDQKLRSVERIQDELTRKFEALEASSEEISRLSSLTDSQNSIAIEISAQLGLMRKDFGILETKERELNEGLSVVDQKTSLLLQRDSEIKSVESKFDKIENLILDLSERHKQISLLQKRIEDLKTDTEEMKSEFESLLGEADEKFEKLSAFLDVVENSIQSEPKKGRSRDSSDMIKKKKATVIHLHDNFNWSSDVIAEKLNMEKSLVETILNSRAVAH